MEITKEQAMGFNHISDNEIKQDISDTERELKDYQDELEVLIRNRVKNRVRIYMIESHIITHKDFIIKLNAILKYRAE